MLKSLFVTHRSPPLPGWLEAFPDAQIVLAKNAGKKSSRQTGAYMVWLHLSDTENPVEQLASVKNHFPSVPVVILANVPEESQALALLGAGASGYVSSLALPSLLRQVALVVENGGLWVGPAVMQRFLKAVSARPGWVNNGQVLDSLSPRQREVAEAVCLGASNKEIARQLEITERTVKAHVSSILAHFGIRDRLQLSLMVTMAKPVGGN